MIPFVDVLVSLDGEVRLDKQDQANCPISRIIHQIRPSWEVENCQVDLFTNGITNKIFSVSDNTEKLVFRVFGAGTEQLIDRHSELATFERLAQAGLAPAVHARFQNGIVCGYLPGVCLTVESVREPSVVEMICKEMAAMHKIPLGENPGEAVFSAKARQWLDTLPSKFPSQQSQTQFDEYFSAIDLPSQFCRLQTVLGRIQCPLVFSHNDLLIFNILLDEVAGKVHFIDYEYAGPNYQFFDIGNHFCEYAGVENPEYERDGPSDSERRHFLARYFYHYFGDEQQLDLEELVKKTKHFEMASHFFWTLWAIHQANLSQIPFDYIKYAVSRHSQFVRLSAQLDI